MKIKLDIPPPRATVQQQKIHTVKGRPIVYDPKGLKAARAELMAELIQHRPKAR